LASRIRCSSSENFIAYGEFKPSILGGVSLESASVLQLAAEKAAKRAKEKKRFGNRFIMTVWCGEANVKHSEKATSLQKLSHGHEPILHI
jgi:hypothetical protein